MLDILRKDRDMKLGAVTRPAPAYPPQMEHRPPVTRQPGPYGGMAGSGGGAMYHTRPVPAQHQSYGPPPPSQDSMPNYAPPMQHTRPYPPAEQAYTPGYAPPTGHPSNLNHLLASFKSNPAQQATYAAPPVPAGNPVLNALSNIASQSRQKHTGHPSNPGAPALLSHTFGPPKPTNGANILQQLVAGLNRH